MASRKSLFPLKYTHTNPDIVLLQCNRISFLDKLSNHLFIHVCVRKCVLKSQKRTWDHPELVRLCWEVTSGPLEEKAL